MITSVYSEKVALKALEIHMKSNYIDCMPIYQCLILSNEGTLLRVKEGCQIFLYSEGIEIKGIIAFTGASLCMVHFSDDSAGKSYDVLKTIKDRKPDIIRGNPFSADLVLSVLLRTLAHYQVDEYWTMMQTHGTPRIESYAEDKRYRIIQPEEIPFNTLVPFLIDMEKTFGRNPTSITLLKKKVGEKFNNKAYWLAWDGVAVVGQGHFEYDLPDHIMIGGIFTARHHRNLGVGRTITEALCMSVLETGKQPALLVSMKNEGACHLYDQLGFVRMGIQKAYTLKY